MAMAPPAFVDETGQPLPAHIQIVLRSLLPRLRRDFPTLQDDTLITEIVEAAGRKVVDAERRLGPLEEGLHGYAWVTVRSVALSRVRRVREGLNQATLEVQSNLGFAPNTPASLGTAEAVEREILLREMFAMLSPDERRVALLKKMGYSSQEIAERRGSSAAAVDMMYSRVRAKIRAALEPGAPAPLRRGPRPVGGGDREK
jgi:RNA polymerase sigma factor (sigma-70 family)